MKDFEFVVNGLAVKATYSLDSINTIFIPLLQQLTVLQKEMNRRIIVYLAAPPAVGKSTLGELLSHLSKNSYGTREIQVVGLDGFHFPQSFLREQFINVGGKEVLMNDVKGCPETFDISKITAMIKNMKNQNVSWPRYDRNIHDVIEDGQQVEKSIVIIEGNWLLLDEKPWDELQSLCDFSVFIKAQERVLIERLIKRKISGGLTEEQAKEFYNQSDKKNVERVLKNRLKADLELEMLENGQYVKGGS